MSTMSSVAAWRRMLLVGITALIALLAVSFSAPDEAKAFYNPSVVLPNHQGWVYVRREAVACPMIYPAPAYCSRPQSKTAWRWTGSSWSQSSLTGGTMVYAYPYSGNWMWVWTQRTGWLAMSRFDLDSGRRCPVGALC